MATITISTITSTLTTYIATTITINKSISGNFVSTITKGTMITTTVTNPDGISSLQNIEDIFITVLVTVVLSLITVGIQ